jgi:fengycin family lipopeptide synthetase D
MKLYKEFFKSVKKYQKKNAITDSKETLTYYDLYKRINYYAYQIKDNEHSCGIIYLPKCVDLVAVQLALNLKNISFLTLEWGQEKRKDECIAQTKPSVLITLIDNEVKVIHFEDFKTYPDDVGYIVFSSGSTGKPKQIWMKDEPVINVVKQQAKITAMNENGAFLWLLNSAFDASLSDIYVTLLSGGHLVVTENNALNINSNIELIRKYNVTHTDIPPIVFSLWLKKFKKQAIPQSLKHIVFGGELANEQNVKELLEFVSLYNAYGPTETTICASMCKVDSKWNYKDVGKALKGVIFEIIDGELHIGGNHCAVGYDNDELNKKFYTNQDGIKFFKTGDIFEKKRSRYFYIGRKDRQFKHNGQLICPEEIENKAKEHGADMAQVIYKDNRITLHYSGQLNREIFEKNIVTWMKPHSYHEINNIEGNVNQNWKLKINE